MGLKTFHMVFILAAIMGADFFGGWALYHFRQTGDTTILALGIVSFAGGLGLAAYALLLVRKMEREHLA
jgi:hypothetical protein